MIALTRFRIARFSLVGVLATAVHVTLAYAARGAFDLAPVTANAVGFCGAFLISYFGHHQWTFARTGNHRAHLARFLVVSMLAYALSHFITVAVTGWMHLNYVLALGVILVMVPPANYVFSSFWAFADLDRGPVLSTGDRRWPALGAAASIAVCAAVFLELQGTPFNHDTSWYFVATRMWMDGTPLYSGIMEINPPMPFYLTRLILTAGDALHLGDAEAFRLVLFALIGVSLVLVDRILDCPAVKPVQRAGLLVASALALTVTPLHDFGQREHLLIILVLPYLVSAAVRSTGRASGPALAIATALLAVPGLLLKPYFLALPLVLTILAIGRQRSLRPLFCLENLIIGSATILYLAAIVIFHRAYLDTVVPLARLVYFAFDGPTLPVLFRPELLATGVLAVPFVSMERGRSETRFALVLGSAVATWTLVYAIQFKGFHYHLVPVLATAVLLGAWQLLAARDARVRAIAGMALALVGYVAVIQPIIVGPYRPYTAIRLRGALESDLSGKSVMVFTTNISRAFPLINMTGMRWTSRYPTQWIEPGAYVGLLETPVADEEKRNDLAEALAYSLRTASEDFVRNRPEIVIVDTRERKSYFGGHDFDWILFMKADAAFAAAWKNYRLDKTIPNFEIWRRKPGSG